MKKIISSLLFVLSASISLAGNLEQVNILLSRVGESVPAGFYNEAPAAAVVQMVEHGGLTNEERKLIHSYILETKAKSFVHLGREVLIAFMEPNPDWPSARKPKLTRFRTVTVEALDQLNGVLKPTEFIVSVSPSRYQKDPFKNNDEYNVVSYTVLLENRPETNNN